MTKTTTKTTTMPDGTLHWDVVLSERDATETAQSDEGTETHYFEVRAQAPNAEWNLLIPVEYKPGWERSAFVILQKNGDIDDAVVPRDALYKAGTYELSPMAGHKVTLHMTKSFIAYLEKCDESEAA